MADSLSTPHSRQGSQQWDRKHATVLFFCPVRMLFKGVNSWKSEQLFIIIDKLLLQKYITAQYMYEDISNVNRSSGSFFNIKLTCRHVDIMSHSQMDFSKAGYTLIVSRISTCSCTISWDCEPITIHFSQYRRFCLSLILRETFPTPLWHFVKILSVSENGKHEMSKMIGEMVYEMPSIHLSFLSFCQHFFAFSSIWR